jgi:hypothetical protein
MHQQSLDHSYSSDFTEHYFNWINHCAVPCLSQQAASFSMAGGAIDVICAERYWRGQDKECPMYEQGLIVNYCKMQPFRAEQFDNTMESSDEVREQT